MMIVHRQLLLFGFLALLGGCASPCAGPGNLQHMYNQGQIYNCYYQLIVTDIDKDKNLVKGKVPLELAKKGREAYVGEEYTFRLLDIDKVESQIKKNETNHFIRSGRSGYLELLPKKPEVEEGGNEYKEY